jgi:hypothetical protein
MGNHAGKIGDYVRNDAKFGDRRTDLILKKKGKPKMTVVCLEILIAKHILHRHSSTMMERRILLLRRVVHLIFSARLAQHWPILFFTISHLLVLLRRITGPAATHTQTVCAGVAFEVVLRSEIATADPGQDEGHSQASKTTEGCALSG